MRFSTLDDWLGWQETLHPNPIDLGLRRVAAVWRELRPQGLGCKVITVAGTNGKGSCVALTERIAREGGTKTGAFTSPHLLRYTERIRINGEEIAESTLCSAFERIDQARRRCTGNDGEPLTLSYFEFSALAAMECFAEAKVDLAILEVGLGGRLDAVNIVDADVAVISSIGIDHVAWLGDDINIIGAEKAGIARKGKPLVLAMLEPPQGLLDAASSIGADVLEIGTSFTADLLGDGWRYARGVQQFDLPLPALSGEFQRRHAAAVMTALAEIDLLPTVDQIASGLRNVQATARQQRLSFTIDGGAVTVLIDVAHNADSATALAAGLGPVDGRRVAVVGILADKSLADIIEPLIPHIDTWVCCTPDNVRALEGAELAKQIAASFAVKAVDAGTPAAAVTQALQSMGPGDELCVFGSFYTVAPVLAYLESSSAS